MLLMLAPPCGWRVMAVLVDNNDGARVVRRGPSGRPVVERDYLRFLRQSRWNLHVADHYLVCFHLSLVHRHRQERACPGCHVPAMPHRMAVRGSRGWPGSRGVGASGMSMLLGSMESTTPKFQRRLSDCSLILNGSTCHFPTPPWRRCWGRLVLEAPGVPLAPPFVHSAPSSSGGCAPSPWLSCFTSTPGHRTVGC